MTKYSLVIVEPSELINFAIKEHLKKTSLFASISTFFEWEAFVQNTTRHSNSILIINPLLIVNKEKEFEKLTQKQVYLSTIAILYHHLPDAIIRLFGDVFYIHEPISKLTQKINQCLNEQKSNVNTKQILSEREKEILKYLAKGLSVKEIGEKLFLSPHTVLSHRKNISAKTGIKTIAGLTVYAVSINLVSIDEIDT
ncbi:MAG: helix-turn-helix transcriptional regulator [Bacteroidales bacterium]|nr:helix-turn-helix transcriptional regulator [Bacteroidales bacterium]